MDWCSTKSAPLVVVFTKYDKLLRTKKGELQDDNPGMKPVVLDQRSKEEAQQVLHICVESLERTMSGMNTPTPRYVKVSSIISHSLFDQC
jgi:hypothetical protein